MTLLTDTTKLSGAGMEVSQSLQICQGTDRYGKKASQPRSENTLLKIVLHTVSTIASGAVDNIFHTVRSTFYDNAI